MAKYSALTVRRLKPGAYDDWRRAWEGDDGIPDGVHAYILRNMKDPDEIIAFGLTDLEPDQLRAQGVTEEAMKARTEAMAPFVESTGADGIYEVIDELGG
jgi:hypothetical protein